MKLKELDIFVVAPPAPGWGGRYWIFPKLTTNAGITGYGECYASTVGPVAMKAVLEDVMFARHMQGENPENIELLFRRVYSSGFTQRPDPTVIGAFVGLEIACWDILGKAIYRKDKTPPRSKPAIPCQSLSWPQGAWLMIDRTQRRLVAA